MRKFNFSLSLGVLLVSGCSTLPTTFTTEKMMQVHQGMSAVEIMKLFGEPQDISVSVCGSKTPKPWNCTTWGYDIFPDGNASFTFSNEDDGLYLNDFSIDRR